ncbi:MAG TPA: hypothetical protein VFR97_12690 [Capillimicrobium sp.]|nr:hypothetical protein [Capillimicrobium sp.]
MRSPKAAITVRRSREEVQRLWGDPAYRPEYLADADATITFVDAPGDRGTEIHVELQGGTPLAKAKDDLRRFKQHVETGLIVRSDGTPEGERAERKIKQRPAQPMPEPELQQVGA